MKRQNGIREGRFEFEDDRERELDEQALREQPHLFRFQDAKVVAVDRVILQGDKECFTSPISPLHYTKGYADLRIQTQAGEKPVSVRWDHNDAWLEYFTVLPESLVFEVGV